MTKCVACVFFIYVALLDWFSHFFAFPWHYDSLPHDLLTFPMVWQFVAVTTRSKMPFPVPREPQNFPVTWCRSHRMPIAACGWLTWHHPQFATGPHLINRSVWRYSIMLLDHVTRSCDLFIKLDHVAGSCDLIRSFSQKKKKKRIHCTADHLMLHASLLMGWVHGPIFYCPESLFVFSLTIISKQLWDASRLMSGRIILQYSRLSFSIF